MRQERVSRAVWLCRVGFGFALTGCILHVGGVPAQQPKGPPILPGPRLLVVSPTGVKAGTTVEVTVNGNDLDDPETLLFSRPGIKAEVVSSSTPAVDPKAPRDKNKAGPATVKFKITVPADFKPGTLDVRAVGRWGVSNPRTFVVGEGEEAAEQEPNSDVNEAQAIKLGTTVSGVIATPTDVDYFRFDGKKGQNVVIRCLASSVDSKLPAAVELYGKSGRRLAFNREYQGGDAVLSHVLPEDGDYFVRVFSFTYTSGGPDHFYRLTASTAPWIDAVFPPVVEPGKATTVTVYGRNLPGGKPAPGEVVDGVTLEKAEVRITPPADGRRLTFEGFIPPRSAGLDGYEFTLRNDAGVSNPYLLAFARSPVALDAGTNDTPETAQAVRVPCEIGGRIEKKQDRDWYKFSARKGEVYSVEIYGDRLGSNVDMYATLKAVGGKTAITDLDDNAELLQPVHFHTRTDDPARYRFVVPSDGDYLLMVSCREADGQPGPRLVYRVRLSPEDPDFTLIVMPNAAVPNTPTNPEGTTVLAGGRTSYTVLAWRHDGFAGDVSLSVEGLPRGVTCSPQVLGPGLKQSTLVLFAEADAPAWAGTISVRGTASIGGKKVTREARPASVTWPMQQNLPAISRLDRDLALAVRPAAPYRVDLGKESAFVQAGEKVTLPIKIKRLNPEFKDAVQLTPIFPQGLNPFSVNRQPINVAAGKDEEEVVLTINADAAPGSYCVVLRGQAAAQVARDAAGKQKVTATVVQPSTPFVLNVLPRKLVNVTISPDPLSVKVGKDGTVTLKLERLANFDAELTAELVVADAAKTGLSAKPVTVPEGAAEVRLTIVAAADASPGQRQGVLVRLKGMYQGKHPVTQDVKLNVTVAK